MNANDFEMTSPQVRFCAHCGAKIPPGAAFCGNCGKTVPNVPAQQSVSDAYVQTPRYISKKEFRNNVAFFKERIRAIAILCYFCSGLYVFAWYFYNLPVIVDFWLMLGLVLGMHLGKSKACAISILILGCLEVIASIVAHSFGGYVWVIAGIAAVVVFAQADSQYRKYISNLHR